MLQPREADVPALFVVFIVLPVIAYFLLGKWHDAVNKKVRVSVLAQRAAEEEVETMACPDVVLPGPSLRPEYHECATCHAPAKTRCSRCKSVRYCSGRCQIIHWRQGHKQTCQQWHGNGVSSSVGLAATEASEQMPFLSNLNSPLLGSETQDDLLSDNFDNMSEPSFVTTDSYNLDTARCPTDRSTMNKSKQDFHMSEDDASNASREKEKNYGVDEGTSFFEISSKDSSFGNKLLSSDFGSSDEKSGNRDGTYAVKNTTWQPHSCATETRKRPKPSITVYESDMGVYLTSDMINCEEGYAMEPLERSNPSGKTIGKGSMTYKKPPYTLGQAASPSQKSQERVSKACQYDGNEKKSYNKNEQRSGQTSILTSNNSPGCIAASKIEVSKKPSKFLKCSLVGLINDNKKNKMLQLLFPYEDLVKFFQYEVRGISPRGLFNCGNRSWGRTG